jgi:hypothetical protein
MIELVGLIRVMRLVGLVLRWMGWLIGKLFGLVRLSELGELIGLIGLLLKMIGPIKRIRLGELVVGRKSRRNSVDGVTTPGELMEEYIGDRVTIRDKVRERIDGNRGNIIRVHVRGQGGGTSKGTLMGVDTWGKTGGRVQVHFGRKRMGRRTGDHDEEGQERWDEIQIEQ